MKRTSFSTSNETVENLSFAQIRNHLKEMHSSISTLKREALLELLPLLEIDDIKIQVEKILSAECNQIVSIVYEEIWELIFLQVNEVEKYTSLIERHLRKIACVSKLFSKLIEDIVPENKLFSPNFSPWILSKYRNRNLQKLSLASSPYHKTPENRIIYDNVLVQFTSLTSLNLARNGNISSECLEKLPNLTKLTLTGNTIISTNAVEKLTKLKILNLFFNSNIRPPSLLKLPLLEELSLNAESLPLNASTFVQLTNLKSLRLYFHHLNHLLLVDVLPCFANLRKLEILGYPPTSFNCIF